MVFYMSINITLTLPEKVIQKIDKERGDINRSKYVLRLLQRAYRENKLNEQEATS
jgi:metal-responsive CopG/Arc/MetJ family transcriptional regulator